MNLLEILNTKVKVSWKLANGYKNRGSFVLDDKTYEIQVDEYSVLGKTMVDFGFTTNGEIQAVNSGNSSARIIGAVKNGGIEKIKKIKPNIILVSVVKTSGLVESRKSLYDEILKWTSIHLGFTYTSKWLENKERFLKIISKDKPSDKELKAFEKEVRSKE